MKTTKASAKSGVRDTDECDSDEDDESDADSGQPDDGSDKDEGAVLSGCSSNPIDPDSDNDGLNDGDEAGSGGGVFGSAVT